MRRLVRELSSGPADIVNPSLPEVLMLALLHLFSGILKPLTGPESAMLLGRSHAEEEPTLGVEETYMLMHKYQVCVPAHALQSSATSSR